MARPTVPSDGFASSRLTVSVAHWKPPEQLFHADSFPNAGLAAVGFAVVLPGGVVAGVAVGAAVVGAALGEEPAWVAFPPVQEETVTRAARSRAAGRGRRTDPVWQESPIFEGPRRATSPGVR
jgi:hypothetical protein